MWSKTASKKRFLKQRSYRLNMNPPKSEIWFWVEWKKLGMIDENEERNRPLFGYIPDVCNRKARYVIEIDGSSHKGRAQYDGKRDSVFYKNAFVVFRVKDGNLSRLKKVAGYVKKRRENQYRDSLSKKESATDCIHVTETQLARGLPLFPRPYSSNPERNS